MHENFHWNLVSIFYQISIGQKEINIFGVKEGILSSYSVNTECADMKHC